MRPSHAQVDARGASAGAATLCLAMPIYKQVLDPGLDSSMIGQHQSVYCSNVTGHDM